MKIDIIIPIWNEGDVTVKCLKSIKKHTKDYRLILIDNASRPAEWKKVQAEAEKHKEVFVIHNNENLGFVKATNQGIATSTSEKIVLMNNDTEAVEGWIDRMLQVFTIHDRIGIVAPLCSIADSWQNIEKLKEVWGEELPNDGYKKVDGMVAFFCSMIDRQVIRKVGYLSEDFGIGLGDDDWYCHLVHEAGFEIYLTKNVVIPHHHRTSFKKLYTPEQLQEIQTKNILKFKSKVAEGTGDFQII